MESVHVHDAEFAVVATVVAGDGTPVAGTVVLLPVQLVQLVVVVAGTSAVAIHTVEHHCLSGLVPPSAVDVETASYRLERVGVAAADVVIVSVVVKTETKDQHHHQH